LFIHSFPFSTSAATSAWDAAFAGAAVRAGAGDAASGVFAPQFVQNFLPGFSSLPQAAQTAAAAPITGVPHSLQNLLPADSFAPHLAHTSSAGSIGLPHSPQNLLPSGSSFLQF
jgi:hypothetical protein